jgi:hypothetical protein
MVKWAGKKRSCKFSPAVAEVAMIVETTDPDIIDGEPKIYFESGAGRREYEAIGMEHPVPMPVASG